MGVIDYKNAALAELERMNRVDRDARNKQVFRQALEKYSFASHQANYNVILQWCNNELTMPKIDWLVHNKPEGLNLDWNVEAERTKLIDAILAARQYPNPEQERRRLQNLTRVQLLDRLAEMVSKEYLSQFTAVELKQALAEVRKTNIPAPGGFERLPAVIVPKGFVSTISTAEFLKHVSRHDLRTFQYYCRRYGVSQVNSYLAS